MHSKLLAEVLVLTTPIQKTSSSHCTVLQCMFKARFSKACHTARVCPLGTYWPYFRNFLANDLFRLNAPSIGSSASMAFLTASAKCCLSGEYKDVTFPDMPCRAVRPTCDTKPLLQTDIWGQTGIATDRQLETANHWHSPCCTSFHDTGTNWTKCTDAERLFIFAARV